ncbi:MAG TPA: hypothetical protein H9846_02780 [Candidatus Gemmiger excrementipullorum]|uniref:Uncharacterized protein n=1 Tax=Candidatus Gemmiger excrementipullorum TaxID=2838610 RepID=A0A9D1XZX8_9FIRM|nr:hypothetical protein [Candidatus Gemmiger excrementipullorum]
MLKNILVLDDGTEIAAGTAGANAIRALTVTETVSSTDDLCPGGACANKLEITIWVEPGSALAITSGTRLRHYRADAAGTRTLCGTYWAVKPTRQSRNTYKIYAYDAVSKLDGMQSTWLRSIQGNFPMTLWAFAQAVAQRCGLAITNTELPRSGDYQVQAFYADNLTGRQLLAWVAEASGTFLRATPDGALEFAWYTGFAGYGIGPGDDAAGVPTALGLSGPLLGTVDGLVWTFRRAQNGYFQGGLSYEDYETAPLDKVQIKQSDDDVGVIYPPDETGTNALVIQGNLLLTTASADALRPVAQALYEQLRGVTYTPLEVSLPLTAGAPAPGQIIAVTDAWGRTMQAYVMQRTVTGQRMTLTCTGNARRDGTAAVNSQTWQNLQGKMLELQLGVDGLNVKASELQGDYAQLSVAVDGISTEVSSVQGDMTNLEQTVDGLELTVVKDGEVRTAFAADSTSVTINSGIITFSGNTIVIQSTNFSLDAQGNIVATGKFSSNNGIVGSGRNEASLTSGGVYAYRYPGNASRMVARLDGYGEATAMGQLILYATQGGSEDPQASITCQNIGARLALANGQGSTSIVLNGAQGAGHFDGMLEVAGQGGLAVTRTITCQDLTAWGNKNRAVRTSYGTLKMAALETPEPTFADSGSARCGEDGTCYVEIEPRYAETVDRRRALQWLVTPTSPGAMWVEAVDSGAVMHGTPGQAFYWLCLGAQEGFSGEYAEPSEVNKPKSVDPAHGIMTDLEKIAGTDIQQADALMDEEGALL